MVMSMDDSDLECLRQILAAKDPSATIGVSHYICLAGEMLKVIEQAQAYRLLNEGNPMS
jgi:hypothetical protein